MKIDSLYSFLGIATACVVGTVQAEEKPNVLIIHTDEQNFRTLGCYRALMTETGAEIWGEDIVVETPHIDYLAENGVLCNRFYATTPVSSPSRSSFMTGLYPQQTAVVANDIPMSDSVITFAEEFRQNGYHTGYFGKWHLDGKARPGWNPERNFGFENNQYMMNRGHYKRIVEKGEGIFDITYHSDSLTSENFMTDFLTRKTLDYIRNHQNEAFCCMVAYPDPHGPNVVRAPYDTLYTSFNFQKPRTALKDTLGLPSWSYGKNRMENMAGYFGMIKCLDDNVGAIIRELQNLGLLERTIIIFTSDHGDLCGEHGRTNKSVPLEASAKVPFIIYYPKQLKGGTVVEEVLSVVDFAPTILSMAGIDSQVKRAGRDFSSLLRGENPTEWRDAVFMRGADAYKGPRKSWLTVVSRNYKLTLSEVGGDVPWLTDVKKDPDELINEYFNSDYQEEVTKLIKELYNYAKEWNDIRINSPLIKKEIDRFLE